MPPPPLKTLVVYPWYLRSGPFSGLVLVLFLTCAGSAAYLAVRHVQIHLRHALAENQTSAELIALVIGEHQKAAVALLQSYASRPLLIQAARRRNPEQLREHLGQLQRENREIHALALTDIEGRPWFNHPLSRDIYGLDLSGQDWYRGVSRHWQPYVSAAFRRAGGEKDLAVAIAVPLFDHEGQPLHILVATQPLNLLGRLAERFASRTVERVTLIDQTGQMLFHSAAPRQEDLTPYPFFSRILPVVRRGGQEAPVAVKEVDGTRHIAVATVDHTDWAVAVSVSDREILKGGIPFLLQIAGICLLLFLAVTAVLFTIRKDVRLRRIAAQLAAEETAREAAEALAEQEAFTRAVLDHLPIGIAVNTADPPVRFEYMNDLFARLYRTTRTALTDPDAFWEAVYQEPAFREEIKKRVLADCAGGDPARMVWEEVPIAREGRETTFVTARNIPLPDKKRLVSLVWDVTERKRAADDLRRRNAYLEALNETALGLMSRRDLAELFQAIVVQARRLCRTDEAWISLLDLRSGEMTFTAADGKSRYLRGSRFPGGRGITGEIWRTGGTVLIENYHLWPQRAQIADYEERRATVAFPLRHGGQIAGVLGLAHHEEGRRFDPEEVAMLERFAELASIALDNARLHERMKRELAERVKAEAEIQRLNEDLERRVSERTTQLEAVNRELTAFSYSVSHDLRAPLRSIDGFGLALLEDYGGRLDDTGKDYIQRVRRATQQMGRLIDDLLKLSRLTKAEMSREAVDLSQIAREVVESLRQGDPGRSVETVIQEGICVQGDRSMLQLLLYNLLENAWKFSGKTPLARIEVGANRKGDETVCFIRDNGVGFDMAYAGKLFGAFQRLHTQEAFPGTGIGLATVQRIVHRHGGWIRAEAEPGRGAAFYFHL